MCSRTRRDYFGFLAGRSWRLRAAATLRASRSIEDSLPRSCVVRSGVGAYVEVSFTLSAVAARHTNPQSTYPIAIVINVNLILEQIVAIRGACAPP